MDMRIKNNIHVLGQDTDILKGCVHAPAPQRNKDGKPSAEGQFETSKSSFQKLLVYKLARAHWQVTTHKMMRFDLNLALSFLDIYILMKQTCLLVQQLLAQESSSLLNRSIVLAAPPHLDLEHSHQALMSITEDSS